MASATAQTTPARKTTTTRRTTATPRSANSTMQAKPAAGSSAANATDNADSKGQNIYAAPGEPINVSNPKKVEGYNGPAPTRPRTGTTLSPR
ncbi:hypothetical protein GCM10027345_39290 [Hymenobacter daeguensis]